MVSFNKIFPFNNNSTEIIVDTYYGPWNVYYKYLTYNNQRLKCMGFKRIRKDGTDDWKTGIGLIILAETRRWHCKSVVSIKSAVKLVRKERNGQKLQPLCRTVWDSYFLWMLHRGVKEKMMITYFLFFLNILFSLI